MATGNDSTWGGPSNRPSSNQRAQEPHASPGTTPANLRPPTPPYPAQSPAQRLAAARGAQSARRTSSSHPDGTPAPLPRGIGGKIGGGAGDAGRVVQRFSGTGLTPRSVVQRQENRARKMTLALAIVAVLLITASALLLFDPTVRLPGFGFAFGQRVTTVNSNQPLLLQGTEPPTATPQNGNNPTTTPTPHGNTGGNTSPTATAVPTATRVPTATPVPTVIPSGAVVHLTPATKPVNWSGALSACPSGCAVPDQRIAANNNYTSTQSGTWVQDYAQGTLKLQEYTYYGSMSWTGTISSTSLGSGTWPCTSSWSGYLGPGQTTTFTCRVNGSAQYPANSISGDSLTYNGATYGNCSAGAKCSVVHFWNPNAFTDIGHYTVTQQDCNNVINGANQQATSNGQSWGNSWVSSWLSQNPGNTEVWGASMSYASQGCSPGVGYSHYPNFTITGTTTATATALVYKFGDAQQASINQLTATLPAYTSLSSSTPCQSGTLSNVSSGSNNFTIQCSASGTEIWDWTSDTALQDSLKNQIAGKPKATAEQICNSMPTEIVAGSCHIDFTGGNVAIVPSDPTKIQIAVP